ncbi:unnamed protein product, partial [Meganyctiphanes norvegica]
MNVEPSECGKSVERDIQNLENLTSHTIQTLKNNPGTKITEGKDLFFQGLSQIEFSRQSVKDNIKQLLEVCEKEQDNLGEIHNETMGSSSHQKIKADISQKQREKNYAEQEMLSLTDNITHKEQLLKQMEQREKIASVVAADMLPKIKNEFEIFGGVSHLKWDYNAQDNLVKGVIFRPEKKDLVPFELDHNTHSQYFITNYLWNLIGQDEEEFF